MKGRTVIISLTVLVSLILHVGATSALMLAADRKERHRATAITMAEEQKKKEKPKPPPPPPRPVKPPPARPAKVVAAPTPVKAAPAPTRAGPAPVDSGLTLGDADGPGMDIGSNSRQGGGTVVKQAKAEGPAKKSVGPGIKKKEEAVEEDDGEEPTKPEAITEFDGDAAKQAAQRLNVEGRIKMRLTIDAAGKVSHVDVIKGLDPQLDAILVAIAEKMRFKPAMKHGKPIAGGTVIFSSTIELTD